MWAQHREALRSVEAAFKGGDAERLLAHAADRVELALFDRTMLYSRAQAVYVMTSFFRDNPPGAFVLEDSSSTDGSWFVTARYWREGSERPHQVYLRLREKSGQWELRELRIERRP